ncbi:hypothetical protein Tco_0961478 [Tanacetum coccineum]
MEQENEQKIAMDEALVPINEQVKIGDSNMRIDPFKKKKEPSYQLTPDILKQYSCYNVFLKTADVAIYMQQVELLRDVLQITPNVPNQEFINPPSHNEFVSFIKLLGYTGSLELVSDMYIDLMYQPWRTFLNIINRFLSRKSSGLDRARQSRIQILWGMFYKKNVDYAALIWEDFQFHIDSRQTSAKRKEQMPYPRFTKVIINHFLSKHNTFSRIHGSFSHMIKYDSVLRKLKFVCKGEEHQKYGMSIPDTMMNDEIRESAHYMTYLALSMNTKEDLPKVGKGKGLMSKKKPDTNVHKGKKKIALSVQKEKKDAIKKKSYYSKKEKFNHSL